MSKTLTLEKRGTICWSPLKNYLAIGTTADTIDEDFDSSSYIEIYEISSEAKLIKKVSAQNRFYKLTWGKYKGYNEGIIVVSNDDSSIVLYDVAKILELADEADVEAAQILKLPTKEVIYDIEFHPSAMQIVAGGANGEFLIYDIEDLTNVKTTQPEQKSNVDIKCVNWNTKVPHIIALTMSSGSIVIFDSKKNKNIMTFNDKTHANWKGACWVPTEKTTLVTISDSDEKPVQLWDVRNTMAPVRIFEGHKAPVWSICWSKTDPNVFATAGQDKTAIWNYETGKIICEFPSQENVWNTCVEWSAQEGRFCTEGLDGFINFYTISDYGCGKHPHWMEQTAGCAFGFGGKRVIYKANQLIFKKLASKTDIKSMDRAAVEEYCNKQLTSTEGEDQETWKLISGLIVKDSEIVNKVCGYERDDASKKVTSYYSTKGIKTEEAAEEKKVEKPAEEEDDDDPFEHMGDEEEEKKENKEEPVEEKKVIEETEEDHILEGLVVSNEIEKAVEFCMKTGRFADAMLITENNKDLHQKVIEEYKKAQWEPKVTMKTVDAILSEDLMQIVKTATSENWKYILYIINIHSTADMRQALTVALADKLCGINKHAALMCYLASGNVPKLIEMWIESTTAVEDIIKRIDILRTMCGQIALTDAVINKIVEYASQLAAVGELTGAEKLIECLGTQQNQKAKELVNRIYYANGAQGVKPQSPYNVVVVGSVAAQQPTQRPVYGQPPMKPGMPFTQPVLPTNSQPSIPTMISQPVVPKPVLPSISQQQTVSQPIILPVQQPSIPKPIIPTVPVVQQPAVPRPVMPTIQQPVVTRPVMPTTQPVQQPAIPKPTIAQPVVPKPAIAQPTVPKPAVPVIPTVQQPVLPKPVMPTVQKQVTPTVTKPVMPQPVMTSVPQVAATSQEVNPVVCDNLRNTLKSVIDMITTKSKGTNSERVVAVAVKKSETFAQYIDKIPEAFAKQFLSVFNDISSGNVVEAEAAFKKILVSNRQITDHVPHQSVASIKYIIDAAKQLK